MAATEPRAPGLRRGPVGVPGAPGGWRPMPWCSVLQAAVVVAMLAVPTDGCCGSACAVGGAPAGGADLTERLLVVDSDAGADDAVALLTLLGAEAGQANQSGSKDGTGTVPVRLLAVTCVHGNTGLRNVTRNVLATLRTGGRPDVPVFRGAAESLLLTPPRDYLYGGDGFGDFLPAYPDDAGVQSEHAAVALVRMAARHPGRISLVCLGPLTNVALAARLDPSFLANLKEIYIFGGSATGVGNMKAATEFNVYMDPEAFQAVLDSVPKPVFLMPWESVQAANITQAWRRNTLAKLDTAQIKFLNMAERRLRPQALYTPSDALLALFVLRPDIVSQRTSTNVQVVLGDGAARAATLVDYVRKSSKAPNVVLLQRPDGPLVQCLLQKFLSAPIPPVPLRPRGRTSPQPGTDA